MQVERKPRLAQIADRKADRIGIAAQVQFRAGARRATVQVCDVSTDGARIAGVFLLHAGERFYVKFEGFEPIEAQVAWAEDFAIGCRFINPLHPAVLARIAAQRGA